MNNALTPVERQLVVDSLETTGSSFIVQAQNDTRRFFIPANAARLIKKSILFVPSAAVNLDFLVPHNIELFFFYQGRGMYFFSKAQKVSQGVAFVLPPLIFKQEAAAPAETATLSAHIFYNGNRGTNSYITAASKPEYPVFVPETTLHVSKERMAAAQELLFQIADMDKVSFEEHSPAREALEITKKLLYLPEGKLPTKNYFPYEAGVISEDVFASELDKLYQETSFFPSECFIPFAESPQGPVYAIFALINNAAALSPFDILHSLMLVPGVLYLSQKELVPQPVEGRRPPLDILFCNEQKVLLGSPQQDDILVKGAEYPVTLYAETAPIQRSIRTVMRVGELYENNGRKIAVCKLTDTSEEDKRFLYEKLYKTRYQ